MRKETPSTWPLAPLRVPARFAATALAALVVVTSPGLAPARGAPAPSNSGPPPGTVQVGNLPTIYDPVLNVTWLADADLAATQKFNLSINADGAMTYPMAVRWVKKLNSYDHGKGYLGRHNWTLPVTPTPSTDSNCSSENKSGGGYFGFGCLTSPLAELYTRVLRLSWPATAVNIPDTKTGLFHDFQPYLYWSGVPAKRHGQGYETFSFNTGWPGSNVSRHFMYVLPMLPGNPFQVKGNSGLVPADQAQAVYEPGAGPNGAGVTWLADADLARSQPFSVAACGQVDVDGSMEQTTAASCWIPALKAKRWLGQVGWELPTRAELETLYRALHLSPQEPVVPVPATTLHGFQDIQPYLYWSCAGAGVQGPCSGAPNANGQQWSFSFGNGFLGTDLTKNSLYVMVYSPDGYTGPTPTTRCPPHPPGEPPTCY